MAALCATSAPLARIQATRPAQRRIGASRIARKPAKLQIMAATVTLKTPEGKFFVMVISRSERPNWPASSRKLVDAGLPVFAPNPPSRCPVACDHHFASVAPCCGCCMSWSLTVSACMAL